MDFTEMKNILIKKLWDNVDRPVILSDQTKPEPEYPYIYYTVIVPPQGMPGFGDVRITPAGDDAISTLHDQPIATFSFTACSKDDDEAIELSENAQHYLEHIGYIELSTLGIVIVEVTNPSQRSGLVVDEVDRRYGFDCRVRFEHTIERNDGSVEHIKITKE